MMMNDFRFYHEDFLLEFIQVYQSLPSLWQVKHPDYHNKEKKIKDFEVLIKKMKEIEPRADRNSVSRKISNLRSVYKRECKRLSKLHPDQKPQEFLSGIWYFQHLHFLQEPKPRSSTGKKKTTNLVKSTNAVNTPAAPTTATSAAAADTVAAEQNPTTIDSNKRKAEAVADNSADKDDKQQQVKAAKLDHPIVTTVANGESDIQVESLEEPTSDSVPMFFDDNEILLPDLILKTEPEDPVTADIENEEHDSKDIISEVGASTFNSDQAHSDRPTRQHNFDLMERNNFDRFDHMTLAWAGILRNLPRTQQIFAEKLINDVMFEAQMENLSRESMLVVSSRSRNVKHQINNSD